MICGRCGGVRVEWKGPWSALTHTECPDCGAVNSQAVEPEAGECQHCDGDGRVEMDNNGPIGDCPVCSGTGHLVLKG